MIDEKRAAKLWKEDNYHHGYHFRTFCKCLNRETNILEGLKQSVVISSNKRIAFRAKLSTANKNEKNQVTYKQ